MVPHFFLISPVILSVGVEKKPFSIVSRKLFPHRVGGCECASRHFVGSQFECQISQAICCMSIHTVR